MSRPNRQCRSSSRAGAIALLLLATLAVVAPQAAEASVKFDVQGRWTCDNRGSVAPISGARVELFRERFSLIPDEKITTRHLGADGRYDIKVSASDNFDLYVKVLLHDDDGVELENWYSPFTWEIQTPTKGSHSGVVGFGTRQISADNGTGTPKCAIWQGAHNAYGDYTRVIGAKPPDRNYEIEADFPCCGVPFTTLSSTQWPDNYSPGAGYTTSFHEFAHSFRHSFDGGTFHFLYDVGRVGYLNFHSTCKQTNEGFAFNEGWAEYWQGAGCNSGPEDHRVEGKVANALTALERCSSRPAMVRVLRENPGSIHSFDEFRARWAAQNGNRFCPATGGLALAEPPVANAQALTRQIESQITAQRQLVAALSRKAAKARVAARHPGRCRVGHCQQAVQTLVAPTMLATRAKQAQLVLDRLEEALAAARKAKFDPTAAQGFANRVDAEDAQLRTASQKLVLAGLKKGLGEVKSEPGFAKGRSSGLYKGLQRQASSLDRVRRNGGALPAGTEDLVEPPSAFEDGAKKVGP